MSFISSGSGRFKYFDTQLGAPVWRGKAVLDFGGNVGAILSDPGCTIDPALYWCIDVSRDAIEEGKRKHPEAHWLFYNRYNFAFNPGGVDRLELPPTERDFDYILAYSVFTHTGKAEMLETVGQLKTRLAAGGVLAFTFVDHRLNPARSGGELRPGYYDGTYLERCLEGMRLNDPEEARRLVALADGGSWCTLINDTDLYTETDEIRRYEENEKQFYMTFYTPAEMQRLFPSAATLAPDYRAYRASPDTVMQHCCVIRNVVPQ
jgi:SAM-dependent methyltransferase